jgi:hypothetical protein
MMAVASAAFPLRIARTVHEGAAER